jgi:hypothetical protein
MRKIEVVPHDESWGDKHREEARILRQIICDEVVAVQSGIVQKGRTASREEGIFPKAAFIAPITCISISSVIRRSSAIWPFEIT